MIIGGVELVDKIISIDWEAAVKQIPNLIELLQKGEATIRDGVLYGEKGIIKHLPMHEIGVDEAQAAISRIIQSGSMTTVVASGVFSTMLLGAIIIQTQFLAKKIDTIQKSIDSVIANIEHQNTLYYIDKISNYLAVVESSRFLLKNLANNTLSITENVSIINQIISNYLIKHNELFVNVGLIVNKLPNQILHNRSISTEIVNNLLSFLNQTMDFLPKGAYILSQLCDKVENFKLADVILQDSEYKYNNLSSALINNYGSIRQSIAQKGCSNIEILEHFNHAKTKELQELLTSDENKTLFKINSLPFNQKEYQILS